MVESEWLQKIHESLLRNVLDRDKPGKERLEAWKVAQQIDRMSEDTVVASAGKRIFQRDFAVFVEKRGWLVPDDDPWSGMPQSALADDGSGRSTVSQRTQWRDVRLARVKQWIDWGYVTNNAEIRSYTCSVEEAKECAKYMNDRKGKTV